MRDADAILTIVPEGSGASEGTNLGVQEGIRLGKPMFTARSVSDVPEIVAWLRSLAAERAEGNLNGEAAPVQKLNEKAAPVQGGIGRIRKKPTSGVVCPQLWTNYPRVTYFA